MTDLLFGLDLPTAATPGADPVAHARTAERLGFDFVSSNDHPGGAGPIHETWTLLTWVAAATVRIRLATRVLGVPYRPPPLVAKMAATLDRLSGGRLILGLGGGSSDDEFRAFGLPVPSPAEKVDGLEEATRILRGLWSEPGFTFEGRRYRTEAAELEPKPERGIPIWMGTYGPRALAVTGRLADGWIPTLELAPPERVPGMRDRVLAAARQAGRDPDTITCVYNLEVRIGDGRDLAPSVVSGTSEEVADRLAGFVRLGFRGMNFQPVGGDALEQAERLANDVLPAVREAV